MNSPSSNPLTEREFKVPFDQIRAEHVEPAIAQLLAEAQERLDRLAADGGPRTFENTLLALESITERLEFAMRITGHLEAVATYPELRAAYNAVQGPVSEFYSGIPLNEQLWRQVKAYAETEEAQGLDGVRARFLKKTVDEFRRNGAELDPDGKKRLAEINVELTKLTTKFSENVLDATNAFDYYIEDEAGLAGLPLSAIEAARESAQKKGRAGWRFTLQAPSYVALMTYLDDSGVREKFYKAFATRASGGEFDNRDNVRRILGLRKQKARLLGFANFADLVIEERMAKTGANAQEFVTDLKARTEPFFAKENEELSAFRRGLEGSDPPEMEGWDLPYYAEKMRKALFDFDEEELRPYFPFEKVLQGMFEITGRLYGIKVRELPGAPVWDPDVKYYGVVDETGTWIGSFYTDYFPRENKRGGAWMEDFITGMPTSDGFEPHLGVNCGNLTPPVGEKPSLLTHREVETIFHEFGHLLHHLLSRVEIRSLAGTHVAWDFVELPSQIMENWCWNRESLDLFARHFETNEPIPEELFRKMVRAKNFRSANAQMRQLSFATVDLALHIDYEPERDGDVMQYGFDLMQSFSPVTLFPGHSTLTGFTHLFANPVGYGAGYYSYKWAEVLDADAFSRFANEGVLSPEVGRAFRDCILARGDSDEPDVLFRNFMARDPDPNALFERSGLVASL